MLKQAESCGLSIRKVQTTSNAATSKLQTHLGQDDTPLHPATQFNDGQCDDSTGFLRTRLAVGGVVRNKLASGKTGGFNWIKLGPRNAWSPPRVILGVACMDC